MAKSQRSPLCNDKVVAHTVAITGETPKFIKDLLEFHARFIAEKIKAGACESVRIRKFGTFKPRLERIARNNQQKVAVTRRIRGGDTLITSNHPDLEAGAHESI